MKAAIKQLVHKLLTKPLFVKSVTPLARLYLRWSPSPAAKQSFWADVVQPFLASRPYKFIASTRFGARMAGSTHEIHQQRIYFFGVWEPSLTRWIGQRLRPGDTFIDVGAHIGYYTLLAASLVTASGRVVAIEASPSIFTALRHNLTRNRVRNVRAVRVAASDRAGVVKIFRGPASNLGATTLVEEQGFELEVQVDAEPLSLVLQPKEMQTARLMKIDVEGAELAVVTGLLPLLPSARSDFELIVEVHPTHLAQQGKHTEQLLNTLSSAGYRAYLLVDLDNESSYLHYPNSRVEHRPIRILGPPFAAELTLGSHLVFSRQDADQL